MQNILKKAKKGFTLVELIVVIAIIAILAAVTAVSYVGFVNNARQSAADTEAAQVKTVLRAATINGYSTKDPINVWATTAETTTVPGKREGRIGTGYTATWSSEGITITGKAFVEKNSGDTDGAQYKENYILVAKVLSEIYTLSENPNAKAYVLMPYSAETEEALIAAFQAQGLKGFWTDGIFSAEKAVVTSVDYISKDGYKSTIDFLK